MYKKNAAAKVFFVMIDAATGAATAGLTITGYRSLEGGAQTSVAGTFTNLGNGQYSFNGAAGDFDGNQVGLFFTATGMLPVSYTIITTGADVTDGVRLGLTSLPNAIPGASGGLPTTNGTKINQTVDLTAGQSIASASLAAQAQTDVKSAMTSQGYTTTRAGYLDTLNGLVAAIWNAATSGLTTAGSIGKKLADWVVGTIDTYIGNTPQTGDAFASLATKIPTNLSFTGANVNAESKVTVAPTDMATATALNSVTTEVNGIAVKVNTLPENPASETTLEGIETTVGNIETSLTEARGELALVDGHVTDLNLPVAAIGESLVAIDGNVVEIMTDGAKSGGEKGTDAIKDALYVVDQTCNGLNMMIDGLSATIGATDDKCTAIKAKTDELTFTAAGKVDASTEAPTDAASQEYLETVKADTVLLKQKIGITT